MGTKLILAKQIDGPHSATGRPNKTMLGFQLQKDMLQGNCILINHAVQQNYCLVHDWRFRPWLFPPEMGHKHENVGMATGGEEIDALANATARENRFVAMPEAEFIHDDLTIQSRVTHVIAMLHPSTTIGRNEEGPIFWR